MTCAKCISTYSQGSYCLISGSTEYCCSPYDNSTNCNTNSSLGVVCSPWKSIAGPTINTYCRGAANPLSCGVDSLDLIANDNSKTVTISNLPYSVVVSNTLNYMSCYYHIAPEKYVYKSGAMISIVVNKATNVSAYLLGGSSRTNASTTIVSNNASVTVGTKYQVDASMGFILVVNPNTSYANTAVSFTYYMEGT
jgi:hypothetical protein